MLWSVISRVDFWIYLVMAAIFLAGIFLCVLPIQNVKRALASAHKNLGKRNADGSYVYAKSGFLNNRYLNDSWDRFLSNLELTRKNNGVCEVYDFINPYVAIHEPGHSAFGETIPGILTTLGIVGSFVGIVTGLSSLDLSSTETMGQSITVLISGMGTAFYTSIAGAVLALVFQLIRRIAISSAERTLKQFVTSCQTHIMARLTPDATVIQALHAILAELRVMNDRQSRGRE